MKVNQPYFALTAEFAAPPRLLFTVMFAGFTGQENAPVYLPPPLFLSVPIVTPVDVTSTLSVALVLVLFASTFRILLATTYSATLIVTVSADGGGGGGGGGAGGATVSTAVLVMLPAVAVMVAELDAVTATVVTVNVAFVAPAGTVTLPTAGTLATAALLLESVTTIPPAGAADVSVTVPVEDAGPTTLVGLSVSVESVPGGGAVVGEQPDRVACVELPPPLTDTTHVGELKG